MCGGAAALRALLAHGTIAAGGTIHTGGSGGGEGGQPTDCCEYGISEPQLQQAGANAYAEEQQAAAKDMGTAEQRQRQHGGSTAAPSAAGTEPPASDPSLANVPWDALFAMMSDDNVLERDPQALPATGYGPEFELAASSIFVRAFPTQ